MNLESEIVIRAQEAANDLTAQAKAMDQSIRKAMTEKLEDTLGQSEKALQKARNEVHSMQNAVKAAESAK